MERVQDVLDSMALENRRQNEVALLAASIMTFADNGILSECGVAIAAASSGVTKAFYIRRQLITLNHALCQEVTRIQNEIRENKKKKLDTSKLKGRLHGIEAVRTAIGRILKTPRARALTMKDHMWLAGAFNSSPEET